MNVNMLFIILMTVNITDIFSVKKKLTMKKI